MSSSLASLAEHHDMRRADLGGRELAFLSLAHACFDGANLDGATFHHVDLSGASFRGASLVGASFHHARATGACFAGIQGRDARWERVTLQLADFSSASLKRARFTGCELESARFDGGDLTLGWIVDSSADRTSFQNALLRHTETLRSSFEGADLATAKEIAYCRELVIEILRRHTERELDIAKMIGAVTQLRTWCYPAWAPILVAQPAAFATAVRAFSNYPRSGCLEALVESLKATPPPAP
jgi:hypothetical protein